MNQRDHIKLLNDGYTIIRRDVNEPQPRVKIAIRDKPDGKTCVASYVWKTYKKFETKAARDRFAQEVLQDDKCIED